MKKKDGPIVRWELLVALAWFTILFLLGIASYNDPFCSSYVCFRCGAARQKTSWQVPRTSLTLFAHSTERQTPVSRSLTTNGIVSPHPHQWVFATGGGNGVRCALGVGREVRATVESASLAQLIESLQRYGEQWYRDKVLTNLFDTATTRALAFLQFPTSGVSDAAELRGWLRAQWPIFDEWISVWREADVVNGSHD